MRMWLENRWRTLTGRAPRYDWRSIDPSGNDVTGYYSGRISVDKAMRRVRALQKDL